jgi:hypothetical protein
MDSETVPYNGAIWDEFSEQYYINTGAYLLRRIGLMHILVVFITQLFWGF